MSIHSNPIQPGYAHLALKTQEEGCCWCSSQGPWWSCCGCSPVPSICLWRMGGMMPVSTSSLVKAGVREGGLTLQKFLKEVMWSQPSPTLANARRISSQDAIWTAWCVASRPGSVRTKLGRRLRTYIGNISTFCTYKYCNF